MGFLHLDKTSFSSTFCFFRFLATIFLFYFFPEFGSQVLPFGPDVEPCKKQGSANVFKGFLLASMFVFFKESSQVIRQNSENSQESWM